MDIKYSVLQNYKPTGCLIDNKGAFQRVGIVSVGRDTDRDWAIAVVSTGHLLLRQFGMHPGKNNCIIR